MDYKKINLVTLILTIILLFALKPEKHLYFDEPFQIMASSGVTRSNMDHFANKALITSTDINRENTLQNVLTGGMDSFHYVLLHYLGPAFDSDKINLFMLFSMLWGAGTLIMCYFLCKMLIGDNVYTSLALVLLFTSLLFLNQSYSIRHYIMALFFITTTAYYFFRYSFAEKSNRNLILMLIFADISYWSHYFTSYIILVFLVYLLWAERGYILKDKKQLAIIALNGALFVAVFLLRSLLNHKDSPLAGLAKTTADQKNLANPADNSFLLFFKNVAINFGVNYPIFSASGLVAILSAVLVLALPLAPLALKVDLRQKRQYYVLFSLGIVSCFFIWALATVTHNTNLFSFRYFLFSIPFCAIFMALTIKYLFELRQVGGLIKWGLTAVLVAPTLISFAARNVRKPSNLPCNHTYIVQEIKKKKIKKIEVPEPIDAVFINCLLPTNYDIVYVINGNSTTATLYDDSNTEKVPIIKNELIVTF